MPGLSAPTVVPWVWTWIATALEGWLPAWLLPGIQAWLAPLFSASLPTWLVSGPPRLLPDGLDGVVAGWHWLDVTLGVALAVVVFNAGRRGFVREIVTLLGLGVGLVLASRHSLALADILAEDVGRVPLLDEAAYLLIVVGVTALAALLAGLVRGALRLPGIGMADRLFGLAFGLLEGTAGLGLLILVASRLQTLAPDAHALDGSMLAPICLRWWLVVAAMLPDLGLPRAL